MKQIAWAMMAAACVGLVTSAAHAQGQPPERGIVVTGTGEAKARADVVELTGLVTGEADLAADAIVKFRDNRRRAAEALEKLEIPGMTINSGGFRIGPGGDPNQVMNMAMRGQPIDPAAAPVRVSEPLILRVTDITAMENHELAELIIRIIDAGKDAGLTIGPATMTPMEMQMRRGQAFSLATFKLADPKALKQQAYEAAIQDARQQAEQLAKLSGVRLGGVLSVAESAGNSAALNPYMGSYAMMAAAMGLNGDSYSSETLEEIPVSVSLTVQFAIER